MKKLILSVIALSAAASSTYLIYTSQQKDSQKTKSPERKERVEYHAAKDTVETLIVKEEVASEVKQSVEAVEEAPVTTEIQPKKPTPKLESEKKLVKKVKPAITKTDKVSTKAAASTKVTTKSVKKASKGKNKNQQNDLRNFGAEASANTLTVIAGMSAATSLRAPDSDNDFVSTSYNMNVLYGLSKNITAQAYLGVNKELTNTRDQSFSAMFVGINNTLYRKGSMLVIGVARAFLPVNSDMRRDTSFQGRLFTRLGVISGLDGIGLKHLSFRSSVAVAKNFHEYTITNSGAGNTNIFSTFSLGLDYTPTQNLILSLYGSATGSWDYDYFNHRNTYLLGQSASLIVMRRIFVSVGHEVGGNTFGYDGRELNIDFLNDDSSSLYSSVSYTHSF